MRQSSPFHFCIWSHPLLEGGPWQLSTGVMQPMVWKRSSIPTLYNPGSVVQCCSCSCPSSPSCHLPDTVCVLFTAGVQNCRYSWLSCHVIIWYNVTPIILCHICHDFLDCFGKSQWKLMGGFHTFCWVYKEASLDVAFEFVTSFIAMFYCSRGWMRKQRKWQPYANRACR